MAIGDDMITFKADGENSEFFDGYSIGWGKPNQDEEMNLTGEATYNEDYDFVYFKVLRKLDTSDIEHDYLIQLD